MLTAQGFEFGLGSLVLSDVQDAPFDVTSCHRISNVQINVLCSVSHHRLSTCTKTRLSKLPVKFTRGAFEDILRQKSKAE
jgi:hypothetical protein